MNQATLKAVSLTWTALAPKDRGELMSDAAGNRAVDPESPWADLATQDGRMHPDTRQAVMELSLKDVLA